MKKIMIILILCLNGCATYTSGNLYPVEAKKVTLNPNERKNMTFSISYYSSTPQMGSILSEQNIVDKIKDTFKNAKIFNKIHFVPLEKKGDYHLHFNIKITGSNVLLAFYPTSFIAWSLPTWADTYIDMTMFVIIDDEVIYSSTITERTKDVFWLPLIVFSPFLNHATVGAYIRDKAFKYFLNAIIEEKLYE